MKKKKVSVPLHHRVIHHVQKLHKIRKRKEPGRSSWKTKWNHFNERYLGWLEHFVDFMIPWMVLVLLFILLGEFSHYLNVFHWHWLGLVSEFFEYYHSVFEIFDKIIISFFVIDLYFNFFKKRTVMEFIRTSILDIIAVAPMGLMFDLGGLAETQKTFHVTTELEKEAARLLRSEEAIVKLTRTEEAAAKLIRGEEAAAKLIKAEEAAKISRLESGGARITRILARVPRFFRLHRLADFLECKKKH